ncbi:MAG: hypothetical protein MNPFHGCM_02335 [Gemmatimonadaceae bacterium]|nr:hypothetical protein [Gemmatimonadaceae bacterium]
MPGRFLPADHSLGDANTIGGYAAVHSRPAAFEGTDGMSYSVEIVVDRVAADGPEAFAAFLLFLRWRRVGAQGVEGHLETDYLAWGPTEDRARTNLGAMQLERVRELLAILSAGRTAAPTRRWWDVMRAEDEDTP